MKFKKLLTLLPVLALAACAGEKTLTQEQFKAEAAKIAAAQETLEVPTEFYFEQVQDLNYASQSAQQGKTIRTIVSEKHQYASYEAVTTQNGEEVDPMRVYLWVEDGVLYQCVEQKGEKFRFEQTLPASITELTGAQLDQLFASSFDQESWIAEYLELGVSNSAIFTNDETIDGIYDPNSADNEDLANIVVTAKSKGNGTVSLTQTADLLEGEEVVGTFEFSVNWYKNYFAGYKQYVAYDNGDGTVDYQLQAQTYKFGGFSVTKPNLADYPLAAE